VKRLVVVAIAAVLFVAGCGGGDNEAMSTDTATVTTPVVMSDVAVYWLRDGKVWPAARQVPESEGVASAALGALLGGPTDQERAELGAKTAIPEQTSAISGQLAVRDGVATFDPPGKLTRLGLAQVVYTLTQFPELKTVEIGGKTYTRADFEDQTPGILVEDPLPFQDVTSPIRATGTANTFEATFNYELTDTDGKIVDENFVTATSGTGTRGTFDFTTKTFTVPFDGVGTLVVFERSAEDGSRTKLVEIPLRMSQ